MTGRWNPCIHLMSPALSLTPAHPSFYDRKTEWRTIIKQFWGPGESLAGKLATFDLYQSYARANNATFVYNRINWDSVATCPPIPDQLIPPVAESSPGFSTDLACCDEGRTCLCEGQCDAHNPTESGNANTRRWRRSIRHFGAGLTRLPTVRSSSTRWSRTIRSDWYLETESWDTRAFPGVNSFGSFCKEECRISFGLASAPSAYEADVFSGPLVRTGTCSTPSMSYKYHTGRDATPPARPDGEFQRPNRHVNNQQLPIPGVPMPVYRSDRWGGHVRENRRDEHRVHLCV